VGSPHRRALLSVSDKSGLIDFAVALQQLGFEILSTGGTATLLESAGLKVKQVSAHTGFPEIMDGRVKTLHPKIHGGLLGRTGIDEWVMREHGIAPIDLLVVNLYPFAATIAQPDCTVADAIENIDIGGPAMVRAAAKNHERVTVIVDPSDYEPVLSELRGNSGVTSHALRRRLAARAYAHTSGYDAVVAQYLRNQALATDDSSVGQTTAPQNAAFPPVFEPRFDKLLDLRYGENPHQQAAFYSSASLAGASVASARLIQGKALSYNNVADGDTALECVRQFKEAACTIVKHANPCGVAVAADILSAYDRAHRTDPTSAYGGIIAFNRTLDARTAAAILERQFVELIIAPGLDSEARAICAAKPNIRMLVTDGLADSGERLELRSVNGGLLVQTRDLGALTPADFKVVTKRQPSATELEDLAFAWRVCKFVKSNAIVFVKEAATLGIGAGQMSRVVSSKIAAMKAQDEGLNIEGAAMASDAFFPFRDGLDAAAKFGIRSVIQPGGSLRDPEVIQAADEHGIAMVFTGMRHFRH